MVASIIIGAAIFGYAGWAFIRHLNKSKEGKCAACSIKDACYSSCDDEKSVK